MNPGMVNKITFILKILEEITLVQLFEVEQRIPATTGRSTFSGYSRSYAFCWSYFVDFP